MIRINTIESGFLHYREMMKTPQKQGNNKPEYLLFPCYNQKTNI